MADWASGAAVVAFFLSLASFVLSLATFLHTRNADARQLGVNRNTLANDIRLNLTKLRILIPESEKSKSANLAAAGKYQSGERQRWLNRLDGIKADFDTLTNEFLDIEQEPKKYEDAPAIKKLDLLNKQAAHVVSELESSIENDRRDVEQRRNRSIETLRF